MTRSPQRLADYLQHIATAVQRISDYTDDLDETGFLTQALVQDAVIRNLEVIGEASRNIARQFPDFPAQHPALPLQSAYEMRNALSHGYFQVDLGIVWRTVRRELPTLKAQVERILAELNNGDESAQS